MGECPLMPFKVIEKLYKFPIFDGNFNGFPKKPAFMDTPNLKSYNFPI
jgi:hypothetical protein